MAAKLVPDGTYPGMWRVQHSNGSLSDMFNRARASEYLLSLLPRTGPTKTEAPAVLAKKTKGDASRRKPLTPTPM
jgi:hypothetical protein